MSRHQTQECRKFAPRAKHAGIADCGHGGGGAKQADAGDGCEARGRFVLSLPNSQSAFDLGDVLREHADAMQLLVQGIDHHSRQRVGQLRERLFGFSEAMSTGRHGNAEFVEPPGADPHAGWCGRGSARSLAAPIPITGNR
ncbi:hypothetical protein WS70_07820 [Burkholderia mayonis]|uniref:Uncharacterized protein n=1 Tax=Burkholderia mayonis TaxID=1385591 RepID=A0A1B4FDG7_9BURK|nr:hypothetical protein WS70_07820 [Burkholderia mayonis]KVE47393.1 hypothetical protein WS70_26595 [Burkholderia mayonis]